jgi:hypothetical protein
MSGSFISDIEIQNVKDFLFKKRYSEITAGLIDVLPDKELESAILNYIDAKIGGINTREKFELLPESFQLYHAMFMVEASLMITQIYDSFPDDEKTIMQRMIFSTFYSVEKQNLMLMAIMGYKRMGCTDICNILKAILDDYNEKYIKILVDLISNANTLKIRTEYVKQHPKEFITANDFQTYSIRDLDVTI